MTEELKGRIEILEQQRNDAMNQCVLLGGQISNAYIVIEEPRCAPVLAIDLVVALQMDGITHERPVAEYDFVRSFYLLTQVPES